MGSFIREKQKKKDLFGHFAVCQELGTRQSDHMASPGHQVRRVLRPFTRRADHSSPCAKNKAHGEPCHFAVCHNQGTRRSTLLLGPACMRLPCANPGGARQSGKFRRVPTSWHTAKSSVTLLDRRHDVFVFFLPCTLEYTRRMCLPCAR